jgi:hypothetical protein
MKSKIVIGQTSTSDGKRASAWAAVGTNRAMRSSTAFLADAVLGEICMTYYNKKKHGGRESKNSAHHLRRSSIAPKVGYSYRRALWQFLK